MEQQLFDSARKAPSHHYTMLIDLIYKFIFPLNGFKFSLIGEKNIIKNSILLKVVYVINFYNMLKLFLKKVILFFLKESIKFY